MVKQINVYFDEEEYKELLTIKEKKSWHDFILELTTLYDEFRDEILELNKRIENKNGIKNN